MTPDVAEPIVTIAVAVVGVAILSVLVSQKSNTAGVLGAFGQMFANRPNVVCDSAIAFRCFARSS